MLTSTTHMGIWAILLVLMTSVVGDLVDISPDTAYNGTLLRFDNLTSAIETITQYSTNDPDTTEYLLAIDNKIIGISNFTIDNPSNITKRWPNMPPPGQSTWNQYQVMQQGTWWSPWYPASCVHKNENSYYTPFAVFQGTSYSASWGDGFNYEYGAAVAAAGLGKTVTQSNTVMQTRPHVLPPGQYGQAWQQQLVVWQDQQFQFCAKKNPILKEIWCNDWSGYVRGNMPVQDGEVFGWSTGIDKMDFSSCGNGR